MAGGITGRFFRLISEDSSTGRFFLSAGFDNGSGLETFQLHDQAR
jgi:hypothetical protein